MSIADLLDRKIVAATDEPDEPVTVTGWIRTSRFAKRVTFLHLYDGSTTKTIQVVVSPAVSPELKARLGVGAAVRVTGRLVASPGPEQPSEIKTTEADVEVVGECDPAEFPIQKKEAGPEFLRTLPHLRVRTAVFQRVFIARNLAASAIHQFFQARGFMWVHTPILTASDCEGAGEMFRIRPTGYRLDRFDDVGMEEEVHFFGQEAFLTVSGQLDVEAFACAFSKVYTFGPTFRAENSHTSRHASEFWMIEPEIAFASLDDVMDLAEAFVKDVAHKVVLSELVPEDYPLHVTWGQPFRRITHRRAMEILEHSGVEFEFPVGPAEHLQAEHERWLCEVYFRAPIFVTHYPADQKPFYMRSTRMPDGMQWDGTVECFDLLVPGVGEIIGGSAREEDLTKLRKSMKCHGMDPDDSAYAGYQDLRRYGSVPHGGFGLGFERLLMWLLDVKNIRDVLPYPRTPGQMV